MYNSADIRHLLTHLQTRISDTHSLRDELNVLDQASFDTVTFPVELLIDAHLAQSSYDHRHVLDAAKLAMRHSLTDRLPDILRLARLYGNIQAVYELRGFGQKTNNEALLVPDFDQWFRDWGLARFRLCYDFVGPIYFIDPTEAKLIHTIIRETFGEAPPLWSAALNRYRRDRHIPSGPRMALLECLARGAKPVVRDRHKYWSGPRTADERFRAYAERNGVTILKQLQIGQQEVADSGSVFLVLDQDGIVKIFKEIQPEWFQRLAHADREHTILPSLSCIEGVPRAYGATIVDDTLSFLRQEMCYGHSLADYVEQTHRLTLDDACVVIEKLATILAQVHGHGVAHTDIRPQNVKIDETTVHLLDFDQARRVRDTTEMVACTLRDPRYTPPELAKRSEAGCVSDLFQLGILMYELVTGMHPFFPDHQSFRSDIASLGFALLNALSEPPSNQPPQIIQRMLARDPNARPSARDVADVLRTPSKPRIRLHGRTIQETRGTVLMLMRMGVPHRGHIDFMARLLELGFRLTVSVNESYTRSANDPLPKWMVVKMVARSLQRRGFNLEQVRFMCTPTFRNLTAYRLYLTMLPWEEEYVVAIASGNEEVHRRFGNMKPILDQRMLFAHEGEAYETRSWGARLRRAIRENDQPTYRDLIASGAEEILTFDEMRAACLDSTKIEYLCDDDRYGSVIAQVVDEQDRFILRTPVHGYSTPEDTIFTRFGDAHWIDRFARDSLLKRGEQPYALHFEHGGLDEGNNFILRYRLIAR